MRGSVSLTHILLAAVCLVSFSCENKELIEATQKNQELKTENAYQREQIAQMEEDSQQKAQFIKDHTKLMGDILANLNVISEKEQDVVELAEVPQPSKDIQEEMASHLRVINNRIVWLETALEKATLDIDSLEAQNKDLQGENADLKRAAEENAALKAEMIQTIDNLQKALAHKETVIIDLREKLSEKNQLNEQLQSEIEEIQARVSKLNFEYSELQRKENTCWFLAADRAKIKALKKAEQLAGFGMVRINHENIEDYTASGFKSCECDGDRIELGMVGKSKPSVRSLHKKYAKGEGALYDLEQSDNGWALVLRDPTAFWKVSRWVVIRD